MPGVTLSTPGLSQPCHQLSPAAEPAHPAEQLQFPAAALPELQEQQDPGALCSERAFGRCFHKHGLNTSRLCVCLSETRVQLTA